MLGINTQEQNIFYQISSRNYSIIVSFNFCDICFRIKIKQVYSCRKLGNTFSTSTIYNNREILGRNTQKQDIFAEFCLEMKQSKNWKNI